MGSYILDVAFRMEQLFGIKITHQDLLKLSEKNADRDILVGDLFELVRRSAFQNGWIDEEIDGEEKLWSLFQEALSMAAGVDVEEILPDRGLTRDLGI